MVGSRNMERILSEALGLPESERAALAHDLVVSLDGPRDAAAATEWDREIRHRLGELEAGTAETIDRDEFRRRLEERLSKI
ncbi:MAG: hypothetical protein CMLOHMNK_00316 [Steroidobacteraceae bacterium]|nr:hypothetical protein [Steroidobacteraceae bacterium]